jgi:hypothetical protein
VSRAGRPDVRGAGSAVWASVMLAVMVAPP